MIIKHTFFFFNDTATTEIYTLSLHDALPIFRSTNRELARESAKAAAEFTEQRQPREFGEYPRKSISRRPRSEEHTSELQSQSNLVCRLLLEKKIKRWDRNNVLNNPTQRISAV